MEFLALPMIGIGVSIVVELVKGRFDDTRITLAILFALSIVCASIYYVLGAKGYLGSFIQIITAASAFYALFIQRFENNES